MFGDPLLNTMNWKTKTLDEITVKIRNGTTPVGAKKVYTEGGVIFLQSQNVWRNKIDYSDTQFISYELNQKMIDTQLEIGDVLITKTGRINTENSSLGRVSLFRGSSSPVNISSEIYLVRVTKEINPEFLMHLLLMDSYQKYIRTCSPGGTDKRHLYSRYVEKFIIIQPPIELQNQFADFVRQVDKSKLLFQQMVSKYDELVKSRFIEMFGDVYVGTGRWEKQSFCDIVEFNPKKSELPAEDFDVSFVPMECVGTDNSMVPQCTKKKSEVIKGYTYFKNNDVVIAKITPCFENGKIAVAHDLLNGVGFGTTEFHVARPKEGISNPIWILNLLLLNSLKINANQNMTGSAGQKRIQTDYFKRLMVEVPPIELQNQFADFVRQVDKSKSEILEGIKRLKSNRITDNEPNSGS